MKKRKNKPLELKEPGERCRACRWFDPYGGWCNVFLPSSKTRAWGVRNGCICWEEKTATT